MAIEDVKDILLIGFGAVGGIYSLVLKRSGRVRLTVVARSNYEAIEKDGVHFQSTKYGVVSGWRPDRLFRTVAEAADRPYSYVFITTKAVPESSPTSRLLQPILSSPYADKYPQPTYVLLQNGLNVEGDLYQAITQIGKEPSIVSTGLWMPANLLAPNVVQHKSTLDWITIGMYRPNDFTTEANTPTEAAVLEEVGGILSSGGSEVTIVPEVQRVKFRKLFWNVSFSSFGALTRHGASALFRPPPSDPAVSYSPYVCPTTADLIEKYTIPTIKATLQELIALARALGFPDSEAGVPSTLPNYVIESMRELHIDPHNSHKTSMHIDTEMGRPIEVECIFGEVVRLAQSRGVDVPRVEILYALLLVVQNQLLAKSEAKR